jgi:hypothetical protein
MEPHTNLITATPSRHQATAAPKVMTYPQGRTPTTSLKNSLAPERKCNEPFSRTKASPPWIYGKPLSGYSHLLAKQCCRAPQSSGLTHPIAALPTTITPPRHLTEARSSPTSAKRARTLLAARNLHLSVQYQHTPLVFCSTRASGLMPCLL